jgi:hypothetical protein
MYQGQAAADPQCGMAAPAAASELVWETEGAAADDDHGT